jgi:hypothetical protein
MNQTNHFSDDFWCQLDTLIASSQVVIDLLNFVSKHAILVRREVQL